ncbi:MAG: AraC family transcriptional regulator, partial [Rhodanobacteraceae bacterium]
VCDLVCDGGGEHARPHGWDGATHLVFPYRGTYVRWRGDAVAVAEAGQVLFFNAGDDYRFVHPVAGGDGSLAVRVEESMLRELAPKTLLRDGEALAFAHERLRIDARAQALVALLRHSLREDIAEPLEAESLALTLVTRSLGPRTAHAAGASAGQQRLVDRAKLVLARDLSRRWALAEIAREVGVSAVYLTQVFQRVEGLPLYRYQLRVRLARALDLLAEYDDLGKLGQDLGFSSHSHFSAAFQQAYGRTPTEFRRDAMQR